MRVELCCCCPPCSFDTHEYRGGVVKLSGWNWLVHGIGVLLAPAPSLTRRLVHLIEGDMGGGGVRLRGMPQRDPSNKGGRAVMYYMSTFLVICFTAFSCDVINVAGVIRCVRLRQVSEVKNLVKKKK